MKTIRDYLESLFLGVKDSPQKEQLKNDLLANMEDRYNELIEEGKGEHEAIGITIAEFGSIDELLGELDIAINEQSAAEELDQEQAFGIYEEEAMDYLIGFRKSAIGIATGVLLILAGVGSLIFFADMYEEALGMISMFICIAVAVGFFITAGLRISNISKRLDDRPIPREVAQLVGQMKKDFTRSFGFCITLGVAVCILSVGMIFFGAMTGSEAFGVAAMLMGLGFGVFLLIYGGMIQGSFERFTKGKIFVADEDQLGPRAHYEKYQEASPAFRFLDSFYWPAVLIAFFVWGFVFDGWGISWIVFPIAGIFRGGIENMLKN